MARQVDVDESSVELIPDAEEGKYRPGRVLFKAKTGQSINLGQIQQAITATRLSGQTNMRVDYLEITVQGSLRLQDHEPRLRVSGADQEFDLAADDRDLEKRLMEAAEAEATVNVVGRVDGWNGRFPVVLRTLAKRYGTDGKTPILLVISSLEDAEAK